MLCKLVVCDFSLYSPYHHRHMSINSNSSCRFFATCYRSNKFTYQTV